MVKPRIRNWRSVANLRTTVALTGLTVRQGDFQVNDAQHREAAENENADCDQLHPAQSKDGKHSCSFERMKKPSSAFAGGGKAGARSLSTCKYAPGSVTGNVNFSPVLGGAIGRTGLIGQS